jgi:hypothetical protein
VVSEESKCRGLDSATWLEPNDSLAEISHATEGEKAQKQDASSATIEECAAAAAVNVSMLTMHKIRTVLHITSKPSSPMGSQDVGVNRKGDANPAHLPRLGRLLCT